MSFTPGPWKAETEYECAVYAHNNQMKIADIRGYGYLTGKGLGGIGLPDEEAKKIQDANARLIAAAPEMRLQLMYDRGLIQALAGECGTPVDDILENIDDILKRINGEEETE